MGRRTRLWVLALRGLAALVGPVVLLLYGVSDRFAAWLPHSTAFVVVFACAALGLLIWLSVISGQWSEEREVYARGLRRLAGALRLKRQRE